MQFKVSDEFPLKRVLVGVVFLLVLAVSFLWDREDAPRSDVVVAIANAPSTLDPYRATDATSVRLLRLLGEGLVQLDDGLQPQPALADEFSSRDNISFTFRWSEKYLEDGVPVTPAFVKAYFDDLIASNSPLKGAFKDVSRIALLDDGVRFELSRANPWFWEALALPIVRYEDGVPMGTGAFSFISMTEQKIQLKRKADGRRVTFFIAKDPMVRILKLMRGEVDVVHNDLPDELVDYAARQFDVVSSPSASYTYMGFLMSDGATADVRVREAISYGVDRQSIIDSLLGGRAREALSLLQPQHPAYFPAPTAYDPSYARMLLKEAGYADGLSLTLSITTSPLILRVAQVIQAQLAEIGVDVVIKSSEWGSFYGDIKKGNFESYILTWVGNFTPEIYNAVFHSQHVPPYGANRGRYVSAKMDALLDAMMMRGETPAVVSVQKLQAEDMVYVPLWRRDHVALLAPRVKEYTMPLDGSFDGLRDLML